MEVFQNKTHKGKTAKTEALLQDPKKPIHSVVFHGINEELVLKATIKTKGGCGLSNLGADN